MSPHAFRIARLIPFCAALAPAPVSAQFPQVVYELQEGSSLLDSCLLCGRADIEVPVSGTFVLERLAVPEPAPGEVYRATEVSFSCASCSLPIEGTGGVYRPNPAEISGGFDLTVEGVKGVQLESVRVAALTPWPTFDLTATEDGTRAPNHRYTLRCIAAPKVDLTPYKLVPGNLKDGTGSFLNVICPACRLAHPSVPLDGTLDVGLVEGVADGLSTYRLDHIRLADTLPDVDYEVAGSGTYQEGGDAAIEKLLRLTVTVNGLPLRDMRGGPVEVKAGEGFPVIDMEVEEVEHQSLWYQIHLVARPAAPNPFRRGDANADGTLDVADPIFHLLWRFSGGVEPSCLEAADADADGVHDLTDAIYELQYLFLGGPAPPEPGPTDCGLAPAPKFSCDAYGPCGVGA